MKKFTLAATAAVLAMGATALYAAAPDAAGKGRHGDRTVTWADAQTKSAAMWTKLDVNKDGKIDAADRAAKAAQKFDKIDSNKDGAISRDEFAAHHSQMGQGSMMGGHQGHGDSEGRGMHRGMRHGMGGGMMMHGLADANKDGAVTKAEFDAATKAHFDKADANKDGKVTPEERRAAMKDMMGKMGHGMPGAGHGGPAVPPPAN